MAVASSSSATLALLNLLGAIALLLWAMRMIRTGVTRSYGGGLRRTLGRALDRRLKAFGMGFAITALLQSSTATCLMTASFAGRGLVKTSAALAVMLGADVGTTVVAQVLTFDLHWLSPLLILGGLVAFQAGPRKRARDLGRLSIGLGLLLLALRSIVEVTAPIRGSQPMVDLLQALAGEPVLAVIAAALLTWLMHSSLAMVLLVATLAPALSVPLVLPLVLGANLGGALPAITATWAAAPTARRVAFGNAAFRLVGVLLCLPFLGPIADGIAAVLPGTGRLAVNFHMAFNVVLAALLLPLVGLVAGWADRLVPDSVNPSDAGAPRYLDAAAIDEPVEALTCAAREALRMVDLLAEMLRLSIQALRDDDLDRLQEVSARDDSVDALYEAIKLYLIAISRASLDEADSRRYADIMSFVTNLEHVGDILDKNVMELAAKKIKYRLRFSDEGMTEIGNMHARVEENLKLSANVFMSGEPALARRLLKEKEVFRDLERSAAESHQQRLRTGLRESLETSALHLDILRDLKRINSHLTSAAYPILEAAGELRRSRLRQT